MMSETKALFTRDQITYVSDPFSYQIGVVFIGLCMNPIRSTPTIWYNCTPHQQGGMKMDPVQPYRLVSRVNIVIRYETLPNLALMALMHFAIAWQIGN